ncbi:DUF2971 domain-containing protein [Phascolarctobacterium faecium]|uniref:DUF2971 domain-containing protein n=1 Tax=Phascolarctobacterium faecium TaxID=33025 RepID=UPI0032BF91ED
MFCYRYRPFNQLSIKELIYDEIYFASGEESNDPYEGKVFFEFEQDKDSWMRLLSSAWNGIPAAVIKEYIDIFSEYLTNISPITFDEVQNDSFIECINKFHLSSQGEACFILVKLLKNYVAMYKPSKRYFVSFTKENDNYLMWSHYANKHRGYCLIFNTQDGYIFQSPSNEKTSIKRDSVVAACGNKFKMREVVYGLSGTTNNAFLCFPKSVSGKVFENEEERLEYCKKLEQPYLEKAKCWEYEKETRLILPALSPWLCSEAEFSNYERLFHYNSTQLVGLILGARLSEDEKKEIKKIIRHKVNNWWTKIDKKEQPSIPGFVLFEAALSEKSRNVEINPIEIYIGDDVVLKKDCKGFDEVYEKWKDGKCLKISETLIQETIVK